MLEKVLSDNNSGVLLGALSLMHDIMLTDTEYIKYFKSKVPFLVRQARNLTSTGYSNDYEVGGVKDPFLQVIKIKSNINIGKNFAVSEDPRLKRFQSFLINVRSPCNISLKYLI